MGVRVLLPELMSFGKSLEVIRLDEGPVLKTGAVDNAVVGSSPTASAWLVEYCAKKVPWSKG